MFNWIANVFSSIYIFIFGKEDETQHLIDNDNMNAINYKLANIQPLDVIMCRGHDFISDGIKYLSFKSMGSRYEAGCFSHVGMIITKDVLDIPQLEPNKLYIWESTISGALGGHIKNIDGHAFLGVQIRDFDEVIKNYCKPHTAVAVLKLKDRSMLNDNLKDKMKLLYHKYNGIRYEINYMQLFAAMYPKLRFLRFNFTVNNFLFCSELVATIFRDLGIFPIEVEPYNVIPADYVSEGDPDGVNLPRYFHHFQFIK
jgi:hypothetical protein